MRSLSVKSRSPYSRALLIWVLFIPVAILNGMIRELTYKNSLGDAAGHQLSSLILVMLFFLVLYLTFRKQVAQLSANTLFSIGTMWAMLAAAFDFIFGHFVDHVDWNILIADYDLTNGRLWPLVLLFLVCSPYLLKLVQHRER
ncbi:MAG TPA: hypothetical protein VFO76_07800 [Candidatus Kapabacteria bacterium]|nr:hypothetical protein [Candidatus Kapabacteria bacterium]